HVAGDAVEERGLAGAVGTDEADDLARLDGERDLLVGEQAAEALRGGLDAQQRRHGSGRRRRRGRAAPAKPAPPRQRQQAGGPERGDEDDDDAVDDEVDAAARQRARAEGGSYDLRDRD